VIAKANAPSASEYIPNLVFLTKRFLLLLAGCPSTTRRKNYSPHPAEYKNELTHSKTKNPYFPPPEGVRPIRARCSSGVNSNI